MKIKKFIEFIGIFKILNKNCHTSKSEWKQYDNLVPILNDLINDIPIEWNDLKFLCKYIYRKDNMIYSDFPHTYLNQSIVKEKVCELFHIR